MRAEQITTPEAEHGEGPVWWQEWGGLRYVDMNAGDVLTLLADGSVRRTHVGTVAAALRPRIGGGAVVGLERTFALATRTDLSDLTQLDEVWHDPSVRFNDGGCDPDGRFYCGSMAYDGTPGAGALYRLGTDPTPGVERVLDDVTVSNGLGFSPDGTVAYYNDTATGRTDVFDYQPKSGLIGRRPFVTHEEHAGMPDGLCVDAEGGVWVALWDGAAVHRYATDGTLDVVVELPASRVTACTFGGDDLATLYITTSRSGIAAGEQPAAGALFAVRPGVSGVPALPYAG